MASVPIKKIDVAIIGGGITGLSTTYFLLSQSELPVGRIALFEGKSQLGGCIASQEVSNCTHDLGAQSLSLTHPRVRQLLDELGLSEDVIAAATSRRAIFSRQKIVILNVFSFLQLKLGGPFALLRAFLEPLISRSHLEKESIQAFFYRRFGQAISHTVILPMLRWIWVGHHKEVDVGIALTKIKKFERIYGSVVLGFVIDFLKTRRQSPNLASLKGGLGTLVSRTISASLQIAHKKSVALTFSTSCVVSEINETDEKVFIDGQAFDIAIVAIPIWKSKSCIRQASGQAFMPTASLQTQSLAVVSICGSGNLKLKDNDIFGVAFPNTSRLANLTFVHAVYPPLCDEKKWLVRFLYDIEGPETEDFLIRQSCQFLFDNEIVARDTNIESTACRLFVDAMPLATRDSAIVRSQIVESNKMSHRLQFASTLEFGPSLGGCIESSYQLTKRLIAFGRLGSFM